MATDSSSRWRWAFRLLVLALVVVPIAAQWAGSRSAVADVLDAATLVRIVGLGVVALVVLAFVGQKRRSRGQEASDRAPERTDDRRVEGSGEVYAPYAYNNQQAARRESERIRNRAEEIAETERDRR